MYKSQQKANAKYDKLHMKTISIKAKTEEIEKIKEKADKHGVNTSLYCRLCIAYCINNDIDINNIDI